MKTSLTREDIINKIKSSAYMVLPDERTTVCILTMENGFTVKGLSACIYKENFDFEIGRKYAFDDAVRQIWPLEGYLLADKLYWSKAVPVATNPPKKRKAPYGYKKDGTPKKRPGRPAK